MVFLIYCLMSLARACDDYSFVANSQPDKAINFLNNRCTDQALIGPPLLQQLEPNFQFPQATIHNVTYKRRGNYPPDIFTYFSDDTYTPNPRRVFFATQGMAVSMLKKNIKPLAAKESIELGDLIEIDGEVFDVMNLYVNYQKVVLAFLYSHKNHVGSFQRISRWTFYLLLGERPS